MSDLYDKITSNAFNFSNNYDSNVDQRTGLYNVTLKIGYLYSAGDLRTQLMINYNPLITHNIGFGEGWALNLSHYDKKNKRVRLSDGSSFNVVSTAGGRLQLRYFKDGCTQTEFKNNRLTIIYKDGTREEFNQNGYLERIVSPSGHYQLFTFRSGRLEKITDTEGKSIKLEYRNNGFEIIDAKGNTVTDGRLQSGHLYRFNFGIDHALILEYRYISGLAFIEEVTHPTGKIEKLYYDPRGIQLPNNAPTRYIPSVSRFEIKDKGILKSYTYKFTGNNYLGSTTARFKAGYDSLYEHKGSYQYITHVEDSFVRKVMTYNKFHLLTDEKIFNKNTNKLLNHNIYEYYADPEKNFEQQVPQFLSLKNEKTRNYNKSGQYKELVHITHYDEFNNLIFDQDAYGIETHNQYYTADELNASDSLYIPHLIKCSEIHPSKKYALGTEKVAKTEYEYQNFKALTGNRTFYLSTKERQHHGDEIKFELNIEYHLNPNCIISYGLESHRKSYNTALTSELTHYIDHGDRIELIKNREYFDGLTKVEKNIYDALTQEEIEKTDYLGNQTKYYFDGHGRLTKEIFKPGTDYEFITEYRYLNNDCKMEVIKNDLLFQVIEFDALGRKIKTYKIDSHGKINPDQSFSYDTYDRNILTVTFDESDGIFQQNSLTTEYLDWWTKKEIDENSVFNLTENDPVNLTETISLYSANQLISKTVNIVNELGENIKTIKDSKIEKNFYDGFNQLVKKEDAQGLITEWTLDALGREIKRKIHAETPIEIIMQYDQLHADDSITSISVNGFVTAERSYDGFGRISSETKLGQSTRFEFSTASSIPTHIFDPNGTVVYQDIDPYLELIHSEYATQSEKGYISYDKKTKLVTKDDMQGIVSVNEYYPNRLVHKQIQFNREATFDYSSQGLLTYYRDWFGSVEKRKYNAFGCLTQVVSENYIIHFEYDKLRRIISSHIVNTIDNNELKHLYTYDLIEFDKLASINSLKNNVSICTQKYDYNQAGLVSKKEIIHSSNEHIIEEYEYNELNKLVSVFASGNKLSTFEDVGYIKSQHFSYDIFGNIKEVETNYIDHQGNENTDLAKHTYEQSFLLMSIKHSSKEINDVYFEYDKNGNLLKNKEGVRFTYTSRNLVKSAQSSIGENIADYVYNAQGKLIEQLVPNQGALKTLYVQGDDTHFYQGDVHSKKIVANKHIFGRMLSQQNINQLELSISDFKGSQIEIFGSNKHEIKSYSVYGVLGNKA